MIVISNSSPIINLAAIGQLGLLNKLYEKVIIPPAVHHEITVKGAGQAGAAEIEKLKWLEVKSISNQTLVQALRMELDDGESEAISLAVELNANLLLIDERRGRAVANRFGLPYIGLMGVIIEARQKRLIQAVKPLVDDLISKAGFWISQKLYSRVLEEAGEQSSV